MNNKRFLFYLISVLVLVSLFAIYVLSAGEKITASFTTVTSTGTGVYRNITTAANLNITCEGLSNTSLEGSSNILHVYNLTLFHNLNGSGPTGGLGQNISNQSTPFIGLVNTTASGTNMTATFVVYRNTTFTTNANGALTGTVSPLTDGNYTFGCLAGINVTNATYAGAAFQKNWAPNISLAIDRVRPSFTESTLNVTDGTNTVILSQINGSISGATGAYLRNVTTIAVRVTINEPYLYTVRMYWVSNGSALPVLNPNGANALNPGNLTMNILHSPFSSNNNTVLNGSLLYAGLAGDIVDRYAQINSEGNTVTFMIVANDSAGNMVNLSNNGRGFNITIDSLAPQITFSLDKSRIETLGKIKATCVANDTSPTGYTITLTQPNGGSIEKKPTDGKAEFTGQDTGQAGKYTVTCGAEDSVKLSASSVVTFTTYYGGDDTAATAVEEEEEKVAEVDLSKEVEPGKLPESGLSGVQGESTTFTLDGVTQHRLTFLEVGDKEATLRFESTPVDVKLSLGESKEVDVDGDGEKDLSVSLNAIEDGKAKVTIKTLAVKAKVPSPEPSSKPSSGLVSSGAATSVGVIVVIVLIVAVVIVAYFLLKKGKGKKKGEIRFTSRDLSSDEFNF
ncbi:hypothetical protein HYX16_05520 [Candidatus Woesearchaeota archaeon]|nr:hypothetical protein [Candidatus Woesearchaeota archaeon]